MLKKHSMRFTHEAWVGHSGNGHARHRGRGQQKQTSESSHSIVRTLRKRVRLVDVSSKGCQRNGQRKCCERQNDASPGSTPCPGSWTQEGLATKARQ